MSDAGSGCRCRSTGLLFLVGENVTREHRVRRSVAQCVRAVKDVGRYSGLTPRNHYIKNSNQVPGGEAKVVSVGEREAIVSVNSLPPRANGSAVHIPRWLPRYNSVQLQRSSMVFTAKVSLDTWEQIGRQLLSFSDSVSWWIADWLVYGESEFQDRYEEAIKRTSLSYQTLRNYTWVAREFPPARRRESLSFSHHTELVALEQPEQDYWLRKAEEHNWSRNRLRAEVRRSLRVRRNGDFEEDGDQVLSSDDRAASDELDARTRESASAEADGTLDARHLHLYLSAEEFAQCEKAARSTKQPVTVWAARTLKIAASTMQSYNSNIHRLPGTALVRNCCPAGETARQVTPGRSAGL
jgi:hypothetical protein